MTLIDKVAWIHLDRGRILSTRSKGKNVYYLPGGKREPGESDIETLTCEIHEELTVHIDPTTAQYLGTFEAQAHGHEQGIVVRMTCYTTSFEGEPTASSEIDEVVWLTSSDRDCISPVDQIIFGHLCKKGLIV